MQKNEISVEEIMKEIKLKAKKYEIDERVTFEEIHMQKQFDKLPDIKVDWEFSYDKFHEELKRANDNYHVDFSIQCPRGNFIATIIRKIMIKLIRFYFKIVVGKQNNYNANSVRTLNEIGGFIRDMDKTIDRQNKINEKLEGNIQELILRINKDFYKRNEAIERQNEILKAEIKELKSKIGCLENTIVD